MEYSRKMLFRPRLQGLRALAVLLVVIYHVAPEVLPAGYVGVDVFFVLSGFLITSLLLQEYREKGKINLVSFYVRRLKRLMPALIFVVLTVVLFAYFVLSIHEFSGVVRSAPYAVFWISNFFFAFRSFDYFDKLSQQDLFLHTWSLGVEEQFYLVWPAFLLMVLGFSANRRGSLNRPRLVVGISTLLVASFTFSAVMTGTLPEVSFYLLPSRIWQFGLGALIFLLLDKKCQQESNRRKSTALRNLGVAMVVLSAFLIPLDAAYPGSWSLMPSLGAGAIILGDLIDHRKAGHLLGNRIFVWIGDRSYSIYLWHFPIIGLLSIIDFGGSVWQLLLPIFLTFGLAHLTYHAVELPFWKGRSRGVSPRLAFLYAALSCVFVASLAQYSIDREGRNGAEVNKGLVWRSDIPELYKYPCDTWYSSAELSPCAFGKSKVVSHSTTVVFGDSIGLQWFYLFQALYAKEDSSLVVLTKSACPIVDETYFYSRINRQFDVCDEWRDSAIEWIRDLSPARIIIGSSPRYPFDSKTWKQGTRRVLDRLSGQVGEAVLIVGTPKLSFDGPGCVARHTDGAGTIDREQCLSATDWSNVEKAREALRAEAKEFAFSRVVDFSEVVCPSQKCYALSEDGMVVFRDSTHVTNSFVRSRLDKLTRLLVSYPDTRN